MKDKVFKAVDEYVLYVKRCPVQAFQSREPIYKFCLHPQIYKYFLELLHSKESQLIKEMIECFAISLVEEEESNTEEYPQMLSTFCEQVSRVILESPIWNDFREGLKLEEPLIKDASERRDSLTECVQKYLHQKIYSKVFNVSKSCVEKDTLLFERITSLSFIQPNHLDIQEKSLDLKSLSAAQEELFSINQKKSPIEKLLTILLSCKCIYSSLQSAGNLGADTFFPLLIYVIIQANPPFLYSNLE